MKFVLKNILLFAVLSIVFSAIVSCTRTQTAGTDDSTTVNPTDSSGDKSKGNYPPAPSAIMQSEIKLLDGSTFKLPEKKGKVVVVNLWATWCGPCRGEMPHFVELQDKYKDKGLEIIGLDVDEETKEDIEAFAAKEKLNYTLGWADSKLNLEFVKLSKLQGIPQSIVLDREGRLNGVFAGGGPKTIQQLKQTVERLVSE
ncbi:MAG: redoxin family protein [Acidobacteria bacterium]|nr:redoxin family protein [Acidobacteriota bacterium]